MGTLKWKKQEHWNREIKLLSILHIYKESRKSLTLIRGFLFCFFCLIKPVIYEKHHDDVLVSRRRFLHCAFSGPNLEPEFILFSGKQTTYSRAGDAASERHSDKSAHINSRSVSVALPTWKERRQWRRWWCADRFQMMSPGEQTELISLHYGLVFIKLVGGARMSYSCLTHSAGDTLRSENVKQTRSRVQAADVKIKKQGFLQFWRSIFFSTFIRYCKWLFLIYSLFLVTPNRSLSHRMMITPMLVIWTIKSHLNELMDIEKHKKITKSSVICQSFAQSRCALLFSPLLV